LTARMKAPRARVVVVWPKGVSPAIADAWVEPRHAEQDLGSVVRRVTRSLSVEPQKSAETAPVVWISDEDQAADRDAPVRAIVAASSGGNGLRRTGLVAALVAASLVVLIAAAFALTTPNHPGASGTPRNRAPAPSSATTRRATGQVVGKNDRGCSARASTSTSASTSASAGAGQGVGHGRRAGRGTDRAQVDRSDGCGTQNTHAKPTDPGRRAGTRANAHDHRPESPGRSQGKGHRRAG